MEEHKTVNQRDQTQRKTFDFKEWRTYKNNVDGVRSQVHVKKSFQNETKSNPKVLHYNKKKNFKQQQTMEEETSKPVQNFSPFSLEKSVDQIYQTAIPNCVSTSIQSLF